MALYNATEARFNKASRVSEPFLITPPASPRVGLAVPTPQPGTRRDVTAFINPPAYAANAKQPMLFSTRQDVPALITPPANPKTGDVKQPRERGVALKENFVIQGTLKDSTGRLLANWKIAVGAVITDPNTGAKVTVASRVTGTDAQGKYTVVVQRTDEYSALAWSDAEHTVPLTCTVSFFDGLNNCDFVAPVTFRFGKVYDLGGAILANFKVAWTDPASGQRKAWQGTRTDANGNYVLFEEARAYEVLAISEDGESLYKLDHVADNPDGSRDLHMEFQIAGGGGVKSGTLTDAGGEPLVGWVIVLNCILAGAELVPVQIRGSKTDANGQFNIVVPDSDAWVATAYHEADETFPIPCTLVETGGALQVTCPVKKRPSRVLDLEGDVPLANHRVAFIDPADGKVWHGAFADANGFFTWYEQTSRAYDVWAMPPDGKRLLKLVSLQDNPVSGRREYTFKEWATDTVTVTGTLRDPTGSPVAGWAVVLDALVATPSGLASRSPRVFRGSETDAAGSFTIKVPTSDGYSGVAYRTPDSTRAIPINVAVNPDGSLACTLPITFRQGTAFDLDSGAQLGGHRILWLSDENGAQYQSVITANNGGYQLAEEAATYSLWAMSIDGKKLYKLDHTTDAGGQRDLHFKLHAVATQVKTGTLKDAAGGALVGWVVVLNALVNQPPGTLTPLNPQEYRGSVTTAGGAFSIQVPVVDGFAGFAYFFEDKTHVLPLAITANPDGTLACIAPVHLRFGRLLRNEDAQPLSNYRLSYKPTADPLQWLGVFGDVNGLYSIQEETATYTLWAVNDDLSDVRALDHIVDNADGSRDLFFKEWAEYSARQAGTLKDAAGQPMPGWTVALTAFKIHPITGALQPYAPTQHRGSDTDAAGAFIIKVPLADGFAGYAYRTADKTNTLPLTVNVQADGSLACAAPVRFRHGRAYISGTTDLLAQAKLVWTDPLDGKQWQGRFTDADGSYEIGEEARSYEVYAIFKTQYLRALFLLDGYLDHPDGSRDLFFRKIAEGVLVNVEFQPYTGGFGKAYNADGTFRNLPPEWDFG